ncbi:MAG: ABC transporter ATP-binding protein [Clostridium sp.]|uniref:ABC transporter ATP-binding protein n=1 Tax=Clostridium sp. TaxID=1506 RepID=UPI003F2EF9F4
MSLIEIKDLSKSFTVKDSVTVALDNVSVKINEGEMIAIIGTSGAGKSTLLNILGLLDEQNSGDYILDGLDVKNTSKKGLSKLRNKYFGFVVQHFALIKDYTVYENIEIPLEYAGIKKKDRKEKIDAVLKDLNILEKKNEMSRNLSGGQAQRVAIARAIVHNPKIILADEPTGALDKKTSKTVMDILTNLNKAGKTIIIVTHDMEVARSCQKIFEIEDGKIKLLDHPN